jgi:LDH2 family malate/lactate/ureidoglycolate dehydrogenase
MSNPDVIKISARDLRALVARMFVASGLAKDAACRVAAGLVEADLEGVASHGVMLVDMYLERIRRGSVSTEASAEVVCDRQSVVVLDAGHALGQLTGGSAWEWPLFATLSISAPRGVMPKALRKRDASGSPCATRAR